MKLFKNLALMVVGALLIISCVPRPKPPGHHKAPPGQVKKVTNTKSARPHAPGQLKKVEKNKPIRTPRQNRR